MRQRAQTNSRHGAAKLCAKVQRFDQSTGGGAKEVQTSAGERIDALLADAAIIIIIIQRRYTRGILVHIYPRHRERNWTGQPSRGAPQQVVPLGAIERPRFSHHEGGRPPADCSGSRCVAAQACTRHGGTTVIATCSSALSAAPRDSLERLCSRLKLQAPWYTIGLPLSVACPASLNEFTLSRNRVHAASPSPHIYRPISELASRKNAVYLF